MNLNGRAFCWLAVVVVLLNGSLSARRRTKCPSACSCHSSWIRGVTNVVVECNKRGFTEIQTTGLPRDVTSLAFNDNFISEIPKDLLTRFRYLRELYVYKNFIHRIDKDAFKGLHRLEVLSLHTNRITHIENGTFNGLQRLKRLYMFSNFLEQIHPSTFSTVPALERLYLHENHLRVLPAKPFEKLKRMQVLTLHRNYLMSIQTDNFDGLQRLQQLYIHQNKIVSIAPSSFQQCKQLYKITLGNNLMQNITSGIFTGLGRLRELYLEKNQITTLQKEVFLDLWGLQKLVLLSNGINTLEAGCFEGLGSLLVLSLAGNKLTYLSKDCFEGLYYLRHLFLHDNRIAAVMPRAFSDLKYLNQLYLFRNQIVVLQNSTFVGLQKLVELNLGVNNLTSIDKNAFDGLPQLQSLLLNSNRLRQLSSGLFSGLGNLAHLYLYFNSITFIAEGTFDDLKRINGISWLPPLKLVIARPQLRRFESNMLHCDCHVLWLKQWLLKHPRTLFITCSTPVALEGRNVTSLNAEELSCSSPVVILPTRSRVIPINGSAILQCDAFPGGNYVWFFDGEKIESRNDRIISSDVIQINTFQHRHAGDYVCMVQNQGGSAAVSLSLKAGVEPHLNGAENVTVQAVETSGKAIVLGCPLVGDPFPRFRWFHDGSNITPGGRFLFGLNGNLMIANLNKEDHGTYMCIAVNILGSGKAFSELRILQDNDTSCTKRCYNGGSCRKVTKCHCSHDYAGEFCQLPSTRNPFDTSVDQESGSAELDNDEEDNIVVENGNQWQRNTTTTGES